MIDENPYAPTSAGVPVASSSNRSLWNAFLTLNVVLLALPLILIGIMVGEMVIERLSIKTFSGDPVTYQHSYHASTSLSPWKIGLYFAVPNALLLLWVILGRYRNRPSNTIS